MKKTLLLGVAGAVVLAVGGVSVVGHHNAKQVAPFSHSNKAPGDDQVGPFSHSNKEPGGDQVAPFNHSNKAPGDDQVG